MCIECHGHPGCPVCSPDVEMIVCPECEGRGKFYYSEDVDLSFDDYEENNPEHFAEKCLRYEGSGEIEDIDY